MEYELVDEKTGEIRRFEISYSQILQQKQIEETRKLRLTFTVVIMLGVIAALFVLWYVHDKQWLTRLFGYLKTIAEASR